jgi:hypothetical protein
MSVQELEPCDAKEITMNKLADRLHKLMKLNGAYRRSLSPQMSLKPIVRIPDTHSEAHSQTEGLIPFQHDSYTSTDKKNYNPAVEDNLFDWHFVLRGPQDTPFEGGLYHGRIILPAQVIRLNQNALLFLWVAA